MDHIAVIIVHYNNEADTKECLASLQRVKNSAFFKFSILVIDNGSIKPLQFKKNEELKNLNLVRSEANLGFTGGNNLGISYAREHLQPDYFLLLNNDTIVDPDFLKNLYAYAQQQDKPGLVCPKIYFQKGYEFHQKSYEKSELGRVFWYAGGSIDWKNLFAFHRGVDEVDRGHFNSQKDSEFATGCCLLIPRQIIETIGLLDKNFFVYLEDVDYSLRAKKNGFGIYFAPQSIVWHKNAGSSGGAGAQVSVYYQTRNRLYFIFKHGQWRAKLTAIILLLKKVFSKEVIENKAAWDLIFSKMGKQPIA